MVTSGSQREGPWDVEGKSNLVGDLGSGTITEAEIQVCDLDEMVRRIPREKFISNYTGLSLRLKVEASAMVRAVICQS